MSKHARSKKWAVAKNMPPLKHTIPGRAFSWADSEVVDWLIKQQEVRQIVFEAVKGNEIVFDPATGKWRGVDYEP